MYIGTTVQTSKETAIKIKFQEPTNKDVNYNYFSK